MDVWMVHILPTSTPQTHMCIARRRAYCFYFFCACISTSVRRVFEVSLKCFCAGNARIGVCFVKGCGGTVRIVCIHIPHIDFPISCTLIRINLYINALLEMHFCLSFLLTIIIEFVPDSRIYFLIFASCQHP